MCNLFKLYKTTNKMLKKKLENISYKNKLQYDMQNIIFSVMKMRLKYRK